jgi:hypothetical protein
MDGASERVSAAGLLGAAILALGVVLPIADLRASTPAEGGATLFSPGLGCGPDETLVGTDNLLARVRIDMAARPQGRRPLAEQGPERRGAKRTERRTTPPQRSARKATPQAEEEPRPAFLRTFYTCDAARAPIGTEGTGWRLVGPLRHG